MLLQLISQALVSFTSKSVLEQGHMLHLDESLGLQASIFPQDMMDDFLGLTLDQ